MLPAAKARIAWTLAKKKLGFRYLMEVIPMDASLVKGSHGRAAGTAGTGPVLLTRNGELLMGTVIEATDVCGVILKHLEI